MLAGGSGAGVRLASVALDPICVKFPSWTNTEETILSFCKGLVMEDFWYWGHGDHGEKLSPWSLVPHWWKLPWGLSPPLTFRPCALGRAQRRLGQKGLLEVAQAGAESHRTAYPRVAQDSGGPGCSVRSKAFGRGVSDKVGLVLLHLSESNEPFLSPGGGGALQFYFLMQAVNDAFDSPALSLCASF